MVFVIPTDPAQAMNSLTDVTITARQEGEQVVFDGAGQLVNIKETDVLVQFADSPYTASADETLFVDTSGGNIIINTPQTGRLDATFTIKKISNDLNVISLSSAGTEFESLEDGFGLTTADNIISPGATLTWIFDSVQWLLINNLKTISGSEIYDGIAILNIGPTPQTVDLVYWDPVGGNAAFYFSEAAGVLTALQPFVGTITVLATVSSTPLKDTQSEMLLTSVTDAALSKLSSLFKTFSGNRVEGDQIGTLGNSGAWMVAMDVGDTISFEVQEGVGSGDLIDVDLDTFVVEFRSY